MRRFLVLLLSLCSVAMVMAKGSEKVVMKAVKSNLAFTKVAAAPAIKLIVEERSEGNIIIRATERIIDDVKLEVKGGELTVSYKKDMDFKGKNGHSFAEVYIPYNGKLSSFTAAVASIIDVKPTLNVKSLNIECLGASKIKLNAVAESANIEAVGASSVTADIVCTKINCELAGASNATISGSATKAEFEIVGASSLKAAGFKASQLEADIAGASKAEMCAEMADVEVAGASKANIECTTLLKADASGSSTIIYSGGCRVDIENNSGASTIKKL